MARARIVHQHIDGAEFLHRRIGHGLHGDGLGHVGLNADDAPTLAGDFRDDTIQAIRVDVGGNDLRALARKLVRRRPAKAGCRAGNDDYLVLKPHLFPPPYAGNARNRVRARNWFRHASLKGRDCFG